MLLPLLIVAATLIGGWVLNSLFSGIGINQNKKSAPPFVSSNSKISLGSFILCLFFPESHAPRSSSWLKEFD